MGLLLFFWFGYTFSLQGGGHYKSVKIALIDDFGLLCSVGPSKGLD